MKRLFQSILEKTIFYTLFIIMFLFTAILKLFYLIYHKFFFSMDNRLNKKCCLEKKGFITESII